MARGTKNPQSLPFLGAAEKVMLGIVHILSVTAYLGQEKVMFRSPLMIMLLQVDQKKKRRILKKDFKNLQTTNQRWPLVQKIS